MATIHLTIKAESTGEMLLSDFELTLPVEIGREEDTDYLRISTGSGDVYALKWTCPEVSRSHCKVLAAGSGDAWLQDTSRNGVMRLDRDGRSRPVDKSNGLDLPLGQRTGLRIPGLMMEVVVGALPANEASEAEEPAREDPPAPPPPPEPRHVHLAGGSVLSLSQDGGGDTDLGHTAMVFSTGPAGLSIKTYPMALVEDLLALPQREGRTLAAAIGATEDGVLVLARPEGEATRVRVNRGALGTRPRPLGNLDTIEIGGAIFRATEAGQTVLVCQNCNMSNAYARSDNCAHCGTRLINAETRFLVDPSSTEGRA